MTSTTTSTTHAPAFKLIAALAAAVLAWSVTAARAEKADRAKPLNVEADQPSNLDLQKKVVVFNGNVVITKGTLVIRAAKIEVRETPDGYQAATATGSAGKPATFRQKRDGVDEYIEGQAERLEYDSKADTVRFVNAAVVRRLRGTAVADEITGSVVSYDASSEVFSVSGGAPNANGTGGRVRAVLTPREGSAAAAEAAAQAATPSPVPAQQPSTAPGVKR
jgi:lipopolysaccharide export system protein LptA